MAAPQLTERDIRFQKYFTALAPKYSRLTADTTRLIALRALDLVPDAIPTAAPGGLIHDNACGPGTATSALLSKLGNQLPNIIATDYTPAMIEALQHDIQANGWSNVQASVQDSQALPYPANHFDFSICNISISNFDQPPLALKEIYRTLKPGATAIVTNWKVFGFSALLASAQEKFHGKAQPSPPVAGAEFMEEGYIAKLMVEAGWAVEKVETHCVEIVAGSQEGLEGAMEFLTGPILPLVGNLKDEEKGRWAQCCSEAIEQAKEKNGGIYCEGWVVLGRK